MTQASGIWTRVSRLALGGAAGFWLTNFAISLTPIAAEYRAASNDQNLWMALGRVTWGDAPSRG